MDYKQRIVLFSGKERELVNAKEISSVLYANADGKYDA